MVSKTVLVGERVFTRKKDAEDACRRILYKYPPGSRVAGPEDEQFLLDLLDLHPDRAGKVGVGVAGFEVRDNPRFVGQRTFYLLRDDGSVTDFSFVKCLRPPTHRQVVMAAMRYEVLVQVLEFAGAAYGSNAEVPCAVTGVPVPRESAHVDHYAPTFLELAEDFVAQRGGWDGFAVASADGSIGVRLGDPGQARAWRDHHRDHARLRVVSARVNLSTLRRGVKRRRD